MKAVVYLDTSILSLLGEYERRGAMRLPGREADASALIVLWRRDDLDFVSSPKAGQELSRNRARDSQVADLGVFDNLRHVVASIPRFVLHPRILVHRAAWSSVDQPGGPIHVISPPPFVSPTWQSLLDLRVFHSDDAEHVYHAMHARCDYFLTVDYKTILDPVTRNRDAVSTLCGALEFASPTQLLANCNRSTRQLG